MSSKFVMVKTYYDDGRWSVKRVRDAVVKGFITVEEYFEIVGEPYEA